MSQQAGTQGITPHTAYILSLIGSIFMLISSIFVLIGAGVLMAFPRLYVFHRFGYPMMPFMSLTPIFFVVIGVIGL